MLKRIILLSSVSISVIAAGCSAANKPIPQPSAPKLSLGSVQPLPPKAADENAAAEMAPPESMTPIVDAAGEKYGFPSIPTIWRFADGAPKIVFVCWESSGYAAEKASVQSAVTNTWQANSGLKFSGWGQCGPNTAGIRIQIDDSGPHTKGLGKQLNGVRNGMVLNFTYQNWSPACQGMRDSCNRSIAVHEFGHAIGFSHEQNRPDTPGECALRRQGSDGTLLLTSYDPKSVMNYCNDEYNNNGQLTAKDVFSVQALYCAPNNATCKPQF